MKTLYIHQIYGLFDDGKEMPELFKQSYLKYSYITFNNNRWDDRKYNYEYKLWDKKGCEELINKYPQFSYYYNVKFKIMKCDIIRFLILYEYGGLYSDMDIIPQEYNFDYILDNPDKLYLSEYVNKKSNIFDIEIIGTAIKNNKILFDFLKYIPSQIEEKNNIEIYKSWKIRYVFHTTGPRSFNRFLKQYKEFVEPVSLNTILFEEGITHNNIPKWINEFYNIKFFSFHSLSYNEDIHNGKFKGYKKKK